MTQQPQDHHDIRQKIADYLDSGPPSKATMRTFAGMLETGEAKPSDFVAVGGLELAKEVADLWWHSP